MGARSRSITSRIRWSLLLKPAAAGAAWLFLPWWGFFFAAAYLYFVPFFRPAALLAPFLAFLALSLAAPTAWTNAAYGALAFGFILGIKDLVIVSRGPAYELLAFLLSFAGFMLFFRHFASWSEPEAFLWLAGIAAFWSWILLAAPERPRGPAAPLAFYALAALLLFELGAVILLLPLSFFSKAALLFFGSALLFEAAASREPLSSRQFLAWGGTYAAITFLVVLLASWRV